MVDAFANAAKLSLKIERGIAPRKPASNHLKPAGSLDDDDSESALPALVTAFQNLAKEPAEKVNPTYVNPTRPLRSGKALAHHRWKVLCLVREADYEADETVRKERIKDRVDEWMSSFVNKLKTTKEDVSTAGRNFPESAADLSDRSSFRDSGLASSNDLDHLEPKKPVSALAKTLEDAKSEIKRSRARERRLHEREQRQRIAERAKSEFEVEKRLILDGKMRARKEHLADPRLKLHHDLLKVERKVSRSISPQRPQQETNGVLNPLPKISGARSPRSGRKNGTVLKPIIKSPKTSRTGDMVVKMTRLAPPGGAENGGTSPKRSPGSKRKRKSSKNSKKRKRDSNHNETKTVSSTSSLDATTASDFHSRLEDATETVVASLVYDEVNDQLMDGLDENGEVKKPEVKEENATSVFKSFEKAKDSDDLFRIAEVWVNPELYGVPVS